MLTTSPMSCESCAGLRNQDALTVKTVEVVATFHNPCAPVTQFTCKCRTCGQLWLATEVYDETEQVPSEWTWERELASPDGKSRT
jgi:hypothetical protein